MSRPHADPYHSQVSTEELLGTCASAQPKLTSAELVARAQASSAERTLRRLRQAEADAAALRTNNALLLEHIETLEGERDFIVREARLATVAMLVISAVAGYLAGMLHAGLQP